MKRRRNRAAVGPWRIVVTGTVVALLMGALHLSGALQHLDWSMYDRWTLGRFLWNDDVTPPRDLIVVKVDDRSIGSVGPWPWSSETYATLIRNLTAGGAAVIGFDILLQPKTVQGEASLSQAIRQAGNVILPSIVYGGGPFVEFERPAPPLLSVAAGTGHINIHPDSDGVVRRIPVFMAHPEGTSSAFSLEMVRRFRPQWDRTIPRDAAGRMLVSYRVFAPGDTPVLARRNLFDVVSASEVIAGRELDRVRGKLVLVGVTATGVRADEHLTPWRAFGLLPGVFIQASAIETLLHQDFVRPISNGLLFALLLAACAGAAWVFVAHPGWKAAVFVVLFLGAIGLGSFFVFVRSNGWIPPLPLWTGVVLSYAGVLVQERILVERESARVRATFSKYMSASVVDQLVDQPELVRPTAKSLPVTVVFADIRGFTAYAERADSTVVFDTLNRYLEAMSAAVFDRGGTLDKYVGDAVMAIFGAPIPSGDHALQAVLTGLDIQRAVDRLRDRITDPEDAGVGAVGVGIHTGPAMIGSIGTPQRLEYTAVGDTVNVASHLEDQALPGQVLITEQTRAALEQAGTLERFRLRAVDELVVKGKRSAVRVYEVMADRGMM